MSQNRLTSPRERERTILPSFARYLIKALAGAAGVWLLTRWFDGYPPWATILSVLVLSIPIALAAFYHTVVGRIHRATLYRKGGWIHRWIPPGRTIWGPRYCWGGGSEKRAISAAAQRRDRRYRLLPPSKLSIWR